MLMAGSKPVPTCARAVSAQAEIARPTEPTNPSFSSRETSETRKKIPMNPEKVSEAYHRICSVTSDFWADCGFSEK
jgi:hypothetical protein